MSVGTGHEWRRYLPDASLAVAITLAQLVGAFIAGRGLARLDPLGYVLLGSGTLALAAARRAPIAVLLISSACVVAYQLRGYPGIVFGLPALVAIHHAVRYGRRPFVWFVCAAAILGLLAINLRPLGTRPTIELLESKLLLSGWLVASAVVAEVSRQRAAYLQQVEQRAADAVRTREEMARRRAGEERLRIARELHDSLTHSISVVSVQAQVAVHLARKRGEDVPDALLAIQEAGRDAMRELRATLNVLRQPAEEGEQPGTGLDRLHELVERARSAGVPATVIISGQQRSLPVALDRAAYRIVQEALTNVARHAGPVSASVLIRYEPDQLTVQVDDDGRAALEVPAPGMGLTGMRERVTALGGQLHAGPRPEGGFTVRALLPMACAS
jgi:signal transduction histidine kinase